MAYSQIHGVARDTFAHGDPEHQRKHNLKHVCPPLTGDYNLTIVDDIRNFGVPENLIRHFERRVFREVDLPLPPGVANRVGSNRMTMWIIAREGNDPIPVQLPDETYPSIPFRFVKGEYAFVEVNNRRGPHTIHFHGIEPSPMNDGVGKNSFEIGEGAKFTYQFQPNQAGTFFYHCHKNTVHHFEMGMFGLLVVDPVAPQGSGLTAPYAWGGPGFAAGRMTTDPAGTTLIRYDQEKIWVADDMDSHWHDKGIHEGHDHNQQSCNPADPMAPGTFYVYRRNHPDLNIFHPDVFAVSGVVMDYQDTGPGGSAGGHYQGTITDPAVAITAGPNQKVLIRFLNASYSMIDLRLPVPATVIAQGGFPLGVGKYNIYSRPYILPANTPLGSISARRFDLIIDTAQVGTASGFGTMTYYDWVKGRAAGPVAEIQIPVNIG